VGGVVNFGYGVLGAAGQPDPRKQGQIGQIIPDVSNLGWVQMVSRAKMVQYGTFGQMTHEAIVNPEILGSLFRGRGIKTGDEGHLNAAAAQPYDSRAIPYVEVLGVPDFWPVVKRAVGENAVHVGAQKADLPGSILKSFHGCLFSSVILKNPLDREIKMDNYLVVELT
jgi:hypothetical protein